MANEDIPRNLLPVVSRTYSEFLLQPAKVERGLTKDDVDLSAPLHKFRYDPKRPWKEQKTEWINVAFESAAMQAVAGVKLAEGLAQNGGAATINCSQPIEEEADKIKQTKRVRGGFVVPEVVRPDMYIGEVIELSKKSGHGKFPVTADGMPHGKIEGLLYEELYDESHKGLKVSDRMIKRNGDGWSNDRLERYIAFDDEVRDSLSKANELMRERARSRILLIVDREYKLKCAVFMKDVEAHEKYKKTELVDSQKRYKVAAAVNTHDYKDRVPAVLDAGADWLVIDSSQGYSDYQADTLKWIKEKYGNDVIVVSGNFVTPEGFDFAVAHGADAVKIGIGPGSICTTRTKFGGGAGQATAVMRIAKRRDDYLKETGIYVPIIADGGIVTPTDIIIAFALGADRVMMGRNFAGYHESPTNIEYIEVESKDGMKFLVPAKPYWGEGSEKAKAWRKQRYDQIEIPEGVEGYVPYKGRMADTFPLELNEVRTGIQKFGYKGIRDLNERAQVMLQSSSSIKEGKPHDIYRKT